LPSLPTVTHEDEEIKVTDYRMDSNPNDQILRMKSLEFATIGQAKSNT